MSKTAGALDLAALALGYLAGGLSLVPCSDKTKKPEPELLPKDENGKAVWTPYQTESASAATVESWFPRGCQSVAAMGGKVSGGLEIIDFDDARFYGAWKSLVGPLADELPVQRTGREGGGYQVWFRCPEPGRNDKLAWVPDDNEETGRRCAVETRAEGGYAVVPGSLHPSGRRYEAISGDFATSPPYRKPWPMPSWPRRKLDEAPLTRKEMEAREKAAKTCNRYRDESNGQGSVIDAYNAKVSIAEKLEAAGYTRNGARWKRRAARVHPSPFKTGGASTIAATTPCPTAIGGALSMCFAPWSMAGIAERLLRRRLGYWEWTIGQAVLHLGKSSSGLSSSGESVVRNWTPLPTTSNI